MAAAPARPKPAASAEKARESVRPSFTALGGESAASAAGRGKDNPLALGGGAGRGRGRGKSRIQLHREASDRSAKKYRGSCPCSGLLLIVTATHVIHAHNLT